MGWFDEQIKQRIEMKCLPKRLPGWQIWSAVKK